MATAPGRQVNSRGRRAALICIQSDDAASWTTQAGPAARCPLKVTDARVPLPPGLGPNEIDSLPSAMLSQPSGRD